MITARSVTVYTIPQVPGSRGRVKFLQRWGAAKALARRRVAAMELPECRCSFSPDGELKSAGLCMTHSDGMYHRLVNLVARVYADNSDATDEQLQQQIDVIVKTEIAMGRRAAA